MWYNNMVASAGTSVLVHSQPGVLMVIGVQVADSTLSWIPRKQKTALLAHARQFVFNRSKTNERAAAIGYRAEILKTNKKSESKLHCC